MPTGFEPEFRSSPDAGGGGQRGPPRVLFVDEQSRLRAVTEYVDSEGHPIAVAGTSDPEAAAGALESATWACLVVGDVADGARTRLSSAASCPVVRFTDDPGAVDGSCESGLAGDDAGGARVHPVAIVERSGPDAVETLVDAVASVVDATEAGEDGTGDTPEDPADGDVDDPDAPTSSPADDRAELTRAERAYGLVRAVVRDVGDAGTRADLEETVCDRLVEHDGFVLAWIGRREGADDRVAPGTIAGGPEAYVREAFAPTSVEDVPRGPVLTAVETGEVQVVGNVREAEIAAPWRDLALSHGLRSLAAVPITHGDAVHGVLAVHGDEPGAVDDALAQCLGLLGDTVGIAVTAVQNKRLLQRDVTLQLEFRSEAEATWLVRIASAADCRLRTGGTVDLGDGVLQYLRVEGATPPEVADAAADADGVTGARVVRTAEGDDGAGVVEVRLESSLHDDLSDVGARLREAVATPSESQIVVEAPTDADVRAIHEVVRRYHPGAELSCKTELDEPLVDRPSDRTAADALTDRQEEVLRAAYLAGYYAWPRDTTAEELADSLDIASPTLHQHLRRAERNLFESLFDGE